jgi:hypothetical protein
MHQEAEIREYLEKAIAEFKATRKATTYFLEKNPMDNNAEEYLNLIDSQIKVLEKVRALAWVLNISQYEVNSLILSNPD